LGLQHADRDRESKETVRTESPASCYRSKSLCRRSPCLTADYLLQIVVNGPGTAKAPTRWKTCDPCLTRLRRVSFRKFPKTQVRKFTWFFPRKVHHEVCASISTQLTEAISVNPSPHHFPTTGRIRPAAGSPRETIVASSASIPITKETHG